MLEKNGSKYNECIEHKKSKDKSKALVKKWNIIINGSISNFRYKIK